MARHEADRDDLWLEAVALTSRAEFTMQGNPMPILVGYRDNGWCSIYFGQDVMLQFTTDGGLRRAYRHGELLRTQGTTLARLQRQRTEHESHLVRRDFTVEELADYQAEVRQQLQALLDAITAGQVTPGREVNVRPGSLLADIAETLQTILTAERFLAPAIPGKR